MKVELLNTYLIKTTTYRIFVEQDGKYFLPHVNSNGEEMLQQVPTKFLEKFNREVIGEGEISVKELVAVQNVLDGKIDTLSEEDKTEAVKNCANAIKFYISAIEQEKEV